MDSTLQLSYSAFRQYTSHNSYIPNGWQLCTCASTAQLRDMLNAGVRCIELDVFSFDGGRRLEIMHGDADKRLFCSTSVSAQSALEEVSEFLRQHAGNPTTPVTICVENQMEDLAGMNAFATLVRQTFGDALFTKDPRSVPLNALYGRVIVLNTNKDPQGDYAELVACTLDSNDGYDGSVTKVRTTTSGSVLRRAYPKDRVTSANFDFTSQWLAGVQLIAVNVQCRDHWGKAMKSMFDASLSSVTPGFILCSH